MKCTFCGGPVPLNRRKFCSKKCSQTSWRLLKNPSTRSISNNNPDFWKSETGIGFRWEKYAAELLGATHRAFMGGADLDWKGKQVDVKAANLYRRKNKRGKPVKSAQLGVWVFNRNREKPMDFFLCVCLDDNQPVKRLLIPSNVFPKSGIVIGAKSKYDVYAL